MFMPTGTGLGDRVHLASPSVDLDTHISEVVNVLEFEELNEVTVVGWSYGGMIITGVAERVLERLVQLVYVDALLQADGENFYDTAGVSEEAAPATVLRRRLLVCPASFPYRPGIFADWIRSIMPDPADQAWFFSKMVPHPLATFTQPIRLRNSAAAADPRAFILCTEGKVATDSDVRTAARLRSGLAGGTGSWRTPMSRRSMSRRRPLKCSCLYFHESEIAGCDQELGHIGAVVGTVRVPPDPIPSEPSVARLAHQ